MWLRRSGRTSPTAIWAWVCCIFALILFRIGSPVPIRILPFTAVVALSFGGDFYRTSLGRNTIDSRAVNWGEGAAAVALVLLAQRWAVTSTFLGVFLAQLWRRKSLTKCFINGGASATQIGIGAAVAASPVNPAISWRLLGGVLAFMVVNIALFDVIYYTIGVKQNWREIRKAWAFTVPAAAGTSAIAVIAVSLWSSAPVLLIPYFALAVGFIHFNRQNLRMSERFVRTEHLYDFTKSLTTSKRKDGPLLIAESVHDAVSARRVDVIVDLGAEEAKVLLCTSIAGENSQAWVERSAVPAQLLEAQRLPEAHLVSIDGESVITAPLPLQNRVIGAMSVVEPSRTGSKDLTDDDVRLIETMAQHAAIWLDNGRLVDELREEVAQREHEAFHDSLTDLPNRRLFNLRAEVAIRQAIDSDFEGAVMLLDLDDFKEVNDALGHGVGDQLLLACGEKIGRVLPQAATLARLGGDEFAILLPAIASQDEPHAIANAIVEALGDPVTIHDMSLRVDASIGIAYFPTDATDASVALQRADVAMYNAKQKRTVVELYSTTNDFSSSRKLALQADLRRAIGTDQIKLWYQPKVRLATNEVIGVECLVRWQHPIHGLVFPDEFIPQAEQSGLIGPLSNQVIDIALRQQRHWKSEGIHIRMAVNLSVRNLLNATLASDIAKQLDNHGVTPGDLAIEITETAVMSDPERATRTLLELHELGIHLAVDDFGIGQSSLAYLQDLPFDEVKIDRCFVIGIERGEGHDGIARTVVDLGKNLNLRVVAEGIETEAVYSHLRAIGCEIGQGYFIARPLAVEAFELWLSSGQQHLPAPTTSDERVVQIGSATRRRRNLVG